MFSITQQPEDCTDIMEVLDAREAALCNYEVMTFLREQRLIFSERPRGQGSTATIVLETLTALENSPVVEQSEESVAKFMTEVKGLGLTKAEKLMILNHCPQSEVELHLLVEEVDERINEEQRDKILELVAKHLLKKEDLENEQMLADEDESKDKEEHEDNVKKK